MPPCFIYYTIITLACLKEIGNSNGNGKRHSIPFPGRPRKIKRITNEAFLGIKELLKQLKQPRFNKERKRREKPLRRYGYKRTNISISDNTHNTYEPSTINNVYDSDFWRWRRVAEWGKYINDPLENNKWTQYNLVKYTSK
ncbi:MAG: hypothetical protein B1H08_05625, partial [Candidatus Omnitrophica bacterium 4484_171]